MKKLLGIVVLGFLLTGCFFDKSEKTIMNCADSSYSKTLVYIFDNNFYIDDIKLSLWIDGVTGSINMFQRKLIKFKKAGYSILEISTWAEELKTSKVHSSNKDVIDFLIKEKYRINKEQDDLLKLEVTDRLKDQLYEREFENCKKKRNKDSKTFDLKWEKPKFYKATFR